MRLHLCRLVRDSCQGIEDCGHGLLALGYNYVLYGIPG